jgi:hypothetical protein
LSWASAGEYPGRLRARQDTSKSSPFARRRNRTGRERRGNLVVRFAVSRNGDATICSFHARALGVDIVVEGSALDLLWQCLGMNPDEKQLPLWDLYPRLTTGVLKLADGCPFRCTYCSIPQVYPKFTARRLTQSIAELEFLARLGVEHVAFYDDALLYRPAVILGPFLREVLRRNIQAQFHIDLELGSCFRNFLLYLELQMARSAVAGSTWTSHSGIIRQRSLCTGLER